MCCKGPFKNHIQTCQKFPKNTEASGFYGYKMLSGRKSLFRNFTWTPGQLHISDRLNTELTGEEVLNNTVEKGFHSYIHLFDVPISAGKIIFRTHTPIGNIVCSGKDNNSLKDTIVSSRTFLGRIGIHIDYGKLTKVLFLNLNQGVFAVPITNIDNITPQSFNYSHRMYERYTSQLVKATEKVREVFTFM